MLFKVVLVGSSLCLHTLLSNAYSKYENVMNIAVKGDLKLCIHCTVRVHMYKTSIIYLTI